MSRCPSTSPFLSGLLKDLNRGEIAYELSAQGEDELYHFEVSRPDNADAAIYVISWLLGEADIALRDTFTGIVLSSEDGIRPRPQSYIIYSTLRSGPLSFHICKAFANFHQRA